MDGSESEEEEHSPLDLQEDHADENEGSDDDISEDDYQDSISSFGYSGMPVKSNSSLLL